MDEPEKKSVVPMGDESINMHDLLSQCKPELSADVKQEPSSDPFIVDRALSVVKDVQNQVAGSRAVVPKAETSKASYFCAICLLNIPVTVPNVVITGNSACKRLIRDQLLKKYCKGKVDYALEGLQRKFICRRHVDDVEMVEVVRETVPVFKAMVVDRSYRVTKEVPDTLMQRYPFQNQRVLEPLTEAQVEALRRLRELLYNPHLQGAQEQQEIEYDPEKLAEKQRKKKEKLMLRQKLAEQKKKEKQDRKEEKRNRRDAEKERENAERRKEKVMKAKAAKKLKKTLKKLIKSETPETGRPVRECRQRKERHD